ncbi:MAG: TRAP transporter substrate-binding protein DctP [Treponema sp.]|jgi:TRAP-type C4-dicarboxylate transport system substrate-binding protein|nr:TRAP transporter substrate-binding protein DctP [Treponema sp.]
MIRRAAFFVLAFVCFWVSSTAVFAQRGGRSQGETIEVRLASPLPRNSDWGRALDRIAAEWARVTNNEVRLRIIHDGVEGGEAKMLSSLSADNIQAALFLSSGISEICPAVMTLSIPFFIKNDAELDLVLKDVLPVLESQINKTNFAMVTWSKGGWINVFSKEPVIVPDDLRRQKLATNPELRDMNLVFKTMGYNVVEMDFIDLGPKLANNVVTSIYLTPAAIAPLGLHKNLKNMLDIPISPFLGGIVMNRVTWNKLGPERQRELTRVTQRMAADFDTSMPKTITNAVLMMQKDGLKVNQPTPAQEELWRTEMLKVMPSLIGTTFDRDLYRRIDGILEKARSGQQ